MRIRFVTVCTNQPETIHTKQEKDSYRSFHYASNQGCTYQYLTEPLIGNVEKAMYKFVIYNILIYICFMIANDLLKGTLRTIVLKLLADNGRMYGYEITKKVEELSTGKIKLTFGALYPVLHTLEADGHIKIDVEYVGKRVRKYYSLTEKGRTWTAQKVDEFLDFVNTLTHVLNPLPA